LKLAFSKKNTIIQVIDSGIGIPKGEIKKLFSSFFRASNTGNVEGTGLGLVVAKYFTELHGGTIKVQSRPGEGTIFTIVIPNHTSQGN
jgi:signal transduction histidine kinase